MRHKLIGYIFKIAAQHPKLESYSLEKMPDNIAVSFLLDFESLSKKTLEKDLNYFIQDYIHNIKISEAHGARRVDARCWRSMRKSQDPHNLHVEIDDDNLSESYYTCKAGYINLLYFCCFSFIQLQC
jgi:hypothetical protein